MQAKQLQGIYDPDRSMKFNKPLIGVIEESKQPKKEKEVSKTALLSLVLSGRSEDSAGAFSGSHLLKSKNYQEHQFPSIKEEDDPFAQKITPAQTPQNFFEATQSNIWKTSKGKNLRDTGMKSLMKMQNAY